MRLFVAVEPELGDRLGLAALADVGEVRFWEPAWTHDQLARAVSDSEVVVTSWRGPELDLERWDPSWTLRLVVHAGGSVRQLVPAVCIARGLLVSTTNDALAESVAEFTVGAILAALRGILEAGLRYREAGVFDVRRESSSRYRELRSVTVGVVGLGAIGARVVELLSGFGPRLIAHDPAQDSTRWTARGVELMSLEELAAGSDVLTLHAPLTERTVGLVDGRILALLPDGATLVNTARGALVDSAALHDELRTGRLRAVLDVTDPDEPLPTDSPFHRLGNCWVTPHIGSSSRDTLVRQGEIVKSEVQRFAAGGRLAHQVTARDAAIRA